MLESIIEELLNVFLGRSERIERKDIPKNKKSRLFFFLMQIVKALLWFAVVSLIMFIVAVIKYFILINLST